MNSGNTRRKTALIRHREATTIRRIALGTLGIGMVGYAAGALIPDMLPRSHGQDVIGALIFLGILSPAVLCVVLLTITHGRHMLKKRVSLPNGDGGKAHNLPQSDETTAAMLEPLHTYTSTYSHTATAGARSYEPSSSHARASLSATEQGETASSSTISALAPLASAEGRKPTSSDDGNGQRGISKMPAATLSNMIEELRLAEVRKVLKSLYALQEAEISKFGLTNQEKKIALFILHGETYGEIAVQLYLSESTVRFHVKNILSKSRVKSRHGFGKLIWHGMEGSTPLFNE